MKLDAVLQGVDGQRVDCNNNAEISSIVYDSRKAKTHTLFAALAGANTDGSKYIEQAVDNGASFVITSKSHKGLSVGQLVTCSPRKALLKISANFNFKPETKLKLAAITGTNGKTTIAQIVSYILRNLGRKCGVLGTVEYDLVGERIPAPLTTPESPEYQSYLKTMVGNGAEFAICEFSSQALAQQRVSGEFVDFAVFTNLSRDHLDNHGSMENYFIAKKKLFDDLSANSYAIINSGDEYSQRIIEDCKASVVEVGYKEHDRFQIVSAEFDVKSTNLNIKVDGVEHSLTSLLIGEFNALNLMQAMAVVHYSGVSMVDVIASIEGFTGAGGRLERIECADGRVAFVDYAHTDDALLKALEVLKKITRGRLIVVFGCGGDRDRGKRPLMARVAEENADLVVITNDNPRTEDPEQIMSDILSGIESEDKVVINYNRREAIGIALNIATKDDVVLIAGKGHEDYQIIGKKKMHFDDREIVREIFMIDLDKK